MFVRSPGKVQTDPAPKDQKIAAFGSSYGGTRTGRNRLAGDGVGSDAAMSNERPQSPATRLLQGHAYINQQTGRALTRLASPRGAVAVHAHCAEPPLGLPTGQIKSQSESKIKRSQPSAAPTGGRVPVGAGLLAMALGQALRCPLNDRNRQQAGSCRELVKIRNSPSA
jgi:hypothetical protein